MISEPLSLNEKKISQTLNVWGLQINAVLCKNNLEEHADDRNSFYKDVSTDHAVKKTNLGLLSNLPRLLSRLEPLPLPPDLNPLDY